MHTGEALKGCLILPIPFPPPVGIGVRAIKRLETGWVLVDCSGVIAGEKPIPALLRCLDATERAWAAAWEGTPAGQRELLPIPPSLYRSEKEQRAVWIAHADLDPGAELGEDDPTEEKPGDTTHQTDEVVPLLLLEGGKK